MSRVVCGFARIFILSVVTAVMVFGLVLPAHAGGDPYIVRDDFINFRLEYLTDVGGVLYFAAESGTDGRELWKSYGTEASTVMVKDINPGSGDSNPSELADISGVLYFSANDGTGGNQLWKSDGTVGGTVMVKDIYPGYSSSLIRYLTDANGTLFFRAYDDANGTELWKSDGTEAGTVMVKDINPSGSSSPTNLTYLDGVLYFLADNGTSGVELWRSDGTALGTYMVKDIDQGLETFYSAQYLTSAGGVLYFWAFDYIHGYELWKSDGTESGTMMVKDIHPGLPSTTPIKLTGLGGTVFFVTYDGTTNGNALWKSDGTDSGTVILKDVNPNNGIMNVDMIVVDGVLFFRTGNDDYSGTALWKSDGTGAGTVMLSEALVPYVFGGGYMAACGGDLYLTMYDEPNGYWLFKSDGTGPGTVAVRHMDPTGVTSTLADVDGVLYFIGDGYNSSAYELWALNNITNTGVPELPHYDWDAWVTGIGCDICHESQSTFLLAGIKESPSLCGSCHNAAGTAHERGLMGVREHSIMVNVTSNGCSMPTYGNITSGEYDNRMYAHLKDGDKVVCVTCHNAMRKTEDVGRTWELTTTSDELTYALQNGVWDTAGYKVPRVYRDSTLWSGPSMVKDAKDYLVDPAEYTFNEYSGTVTFTQAQSPADYIYVTLEYPYLRVSNASNAMCSDCHVEQTHQGANCLACHAAHNTDNLAGIKGTVRTPDRAELPVVFGGYSGANSFADGDATYDGVCEVCHTVTKYHRRDGSGFANHSSGVNRSGEDCTTCHTHASGFAK